MRHRAVLGMSLVLVAPRAAAAQSAQVERTVAEPKEESLEWFVGGAVGGLLPVVFGDLGVGAQASVRVGGLYRGLQFQLELSPGSTVLSPGGSPLAMAEVGATIGYLIPMSSLASWIVRGGGGAGVLFDGEPNQAAWVAEMRADVVGVAIRTSDNFFVELNLPSYRLLIPTDERRSLSMMWVTSVGFHYVF